MTPLEISQTDLALDSYLNTNHKSKAIGHQFKVSNNPTTQSKKNNNNSEILKIFLPSLKFFRWAGVSNLYVSHIDGTPIVKIDKKFSLASIYVFLLMLLQIFLATFLILNRILETSRPIKVFRTISAESSVLNGNNSGFVTTFGLVATFQVFYPISGSLQVIAARINFREMATFLNNWTLFTIKYQRSFGQFHEFDLGFLKRFRNLMLGGTFIFFLIFFVSRMKDRAAFAVESYALNFILSNLFTAYFTFTTMSLTLLSVFGLQSIRLAFRETRLGIQKQFDGTNKRVTRNDVKVWTQLVMDIRAQVYSLQKFASFHEFVDLISNFIILLNLSYNIIASTGGGSQQTMHTFGILAVLLGFLRMSLRGVLSDNLTKEEELLAFAVVDMKPAGDHSHDCAARLEMKVLCDTIFSNPSVFTLGNVIAVNKRLVLSLISHLAANLVVLLQFKSNVH